MIVEVKAHHIENGERKSCDRCPLALCINDHLREGFVCSVTREEGFIWTVNREMVFKWTLSQASQRFTRDFDLKFHPTPVFVSVPIPKDYVKV